jgi:hypothetical protein
MPGLMFMTPQTQHIPSGHSPGLGTTLAELIGRLCSSLRSAVQSLGASTIREANEPEAVEARGSNVGPCAVDGETEASCSRLTGREPQAVHG